FVQTLTPEIIEYIEKYGTPEKVCDALKMCKNGTQEIRRGKYNKELFSFKYSIYLIVAQSDDKSKVNELTSTPFECELCKFVINYVDAFVKNNKSEAAIEAALDQVCKILPHSINASCYQFVQTLTPEIIEYIEKYGTPEKVCDALKMCKNGTQ